MKNSKLKTNIYMSKPQLILQPYHASTVDLLKCFAQGTPLSCDQLNFVEWHQQQLNSAEFDPVYKYYIESAKKKHAVSKSFILSEQFNAESIKQFKKRLNLFLQQKTSVIFSLTQEQFEKFKELNIHELIFLHGDQLLTNAPFIPGGLPPVIYFQWGNLFGVVKYVILAGEKALKANLLIYFEDSQERNLDQCVLDYQNKLKTELELQKNILHDHKIEPPAFDHFIIKPPLLSFDSFKK